MLRSLVRATSLTLIAGLASIWASAGVLRRAWWQPEPYLAIAISVGVGVLWLLKRQGRQAIPAASIFVVVTLIFLVWIAFLVTFDRGGVEL